MDIGNALPTRKAGSSIIKWQEVSGDANGIAILASQRSVPKESALHGPETNLGPVLMGSFPCLPHKPMRDIRTELPGEEGNTDMTKGEEPASPAGGEEMKVA